jgi:hypothetical protein
MPSIDPKLAALDRLVGRWLTEATHPMVPGTVVRGTAEFAWLEGRRFIQLRTTTDHPLFPSELSVIGCMEHDRADEKGAITTPSDTLKMHQFDSRGVFRVCDVEVDDRAWHWFRMAQGFSQRFTGTFSDDGEVIHGLSQLCRDDVNWQDDLRITYRRLPGREASGR